MRLIRNAISGGIGAEDVARERRDHDREVHAKDADQAE
jgi:hypothetical protein